MITHDYKLIFVHIPKCAGRSISDIFNQRFDQYTAYYYKTTYQYFYEGYSKFAIVRNPFSRLVSMYHYIQQHRRHKDEPIALNGASFKEWTMANFNNYKGPFPYDSPEADRGTDYMLGSPHWFTAQKNFLSGADGNILDEFTIFRMEDGMDKVNAYLKSHGVDATIPHVNKSTHKPWQEYYDDELLEFLRGNPFFKDDCIAFDYGGYTF